MKYQRAKELLGENIERMSLEQLQKYRVKLTDAWRESRADYGFQQSVKDGYYLIVCSESASGFTPRDPWLEHELAEKLDKVVELEMSILNKAEK